MVNGHQTAPVYVRSASAAASHSRKHVVSPPRAMSRQEPRRLGQHPEKSTPRSAHDSKFSPGYMDQHGRSALFLSAAGGKVDAVLSLIRAGADVTITGDNGWPPLYISARNGHLDIVKVISPLKIPILPLFC